MTLRGGMLVVSALCMLPRAAAPASAHDDDEPARIRHFEGGTLRLSLSASSLALLGPGLATQQASVAPIHPGPGRQLHNPALLGMVRRPLLSADIAPHLDLNLGRFADLDARLGDHLRLGAALGRATSIRPACPRASWPARTASSSAGPRPQRASSRSDRHRTPCCRWPARTSAS